MKVQSRKNGNPKLAIVTGLIVVAALVSYGYQFSPSPILGELKEAYTLNSNTMLNLSMSVLWPPTIVAALLTGGLIKKIGLYRIQLLSLALVTVGCFLNLVAPSYFIFLAGRVIFGFGFGFLVSFMGAAIMQWYDPVQREKMNTLNGLFPFLGIALCFNLTIPLLKALDSNWAALLALWGIPTAIAFVLWLFYVRTDRVGYAATPEGEAEMKAEADLPAEKGLYKNLLKRKEILLMCLIFICDFFCVQYVSTIMPTYFMEAGNVSADLASMLTGLAFPVVGILGAFLGGALMTKTGLRRPILIVSNILKLLGILAIVLGGVIVSLPVMVIGLSIFAIGNSLWMPVLFTVIMELDDMNPTRAAGSFALVSAAAYISGFISPIVGGWLTDTLASSVGKLGTVEGNVYGLTWSLCAFALVNIIGLWASYKIRETGPKAKHAKGKATGKLRSA